MKKYKFILKLKLIIIVLSILFFILSNCANNQITNIILDKYYYSFISQEEIEIKQYIKKLDEYDSEYSICFLDRLGLKHLYVFAMPIRYYDILNLKQVTIDDRISNNKDEDEIIYPYKISKSNINIKFPENLNANKGILMEKENYKLEYYPQNTEDIIKGKYYKEKENIINVKKNAIVYKYKKFEFLTYPTLTGVENEFIINKGDENLTYEFIIKTEKLNPVMTNSGYVLLKDNNDENILGIIQIPILKDSNNENPQISINNKLSLRKNDDNQYVIVINLDIDFFNRENLKYPIKFNMPIEFKRNNQPDTHVYSNLPDKNMYLTNCYSLGYDNILGNGKTYIRFNLANSYIIDPSNIKTIKYYTYSLNKSNANASVNVNEVLEHWCSVNSNWNTNIKTGKIIDNIKIDNVGEKEFDITDKAKKWFADEELIIEGYGIMLDSDSKNEPIIFLSNDNGLYNVKTEIIFE